MKHYQPRKYDYPEFEDSFRALLRDAEAAADVSKHTPAPRKQAVGNGLAVCALRTLLQYGLHAHERREEAWPCQRDGPPSLGANCLTAGVSPYHACSLQSPARY